jgi:hypothetical protein
VSGSSDIMSPALALPSKRRILGEDVSVSQPAPGPSQEPASLKSLAPQYDEAQHKTYVDRLDAALKDQRNRNIALSGPYGTGKSSVLDKFQQEHKDSTLRLAISTLAPDAAGATLTNRIQKEVLKQLVYSARPSTLRHSRFSRRWPLSWRRAAGESAAAVGMLGVLLALLGRLPSPVATGTGHSTTQRVLIWATLAALLIVTGTVLRKVTYRFVVSDVSAAGATLKLSEAGNTYFDEHLDEILYFFDHESKDIVIFEDLDRYNDPQIFQALRELNTLLNNTPKRRDKIAKDQTPLRFVYAMRDSLFEKIGEDTAEVADDDAARAENIRANRTKFFEVVIPVVPFISHRTAREHLHQLLRETGITGVDRALVELVAKHATDMRLLVNMRNEYLVFAERLLNSDKVAPELSASHLFALIAYKNFHLQDFENIARRARTSTACTTTTGRSWPRQSRLGSEPSGICCRRARAPGPSGPMRRNSPNGSTLLARSRATAAGGRGPSSSRSTRSRTTSRRPVPRSSGMRSFARDR